MTMDNKTFKSLGYGKLKKLCSNCPFRKDGKAIALSPGRLEGIIQDLVDDDWSSFYCHKTVYCSNGGEHDDEGNYHPSGEESMCAGAMGYLHKIGRPSVGMRLALAMKDISVDDLDNMSSMVIDVMEIEEKSKRVC